MPFQTAFFAAGCFWGVEETFRTMKGVLETTVGYTGGTVANPTYEQVCTGETGHAETLKIVFDPSMISYETLLETFWKNHNPTVLNRQGPDIGTQYRSAIFYTTSEQKAVAEKSRAALEATGDWKKPIVTEISAAGPFYRAEEYHQKYEMKHGRRVC